MENKNRIKSQQIRESCDIQPINEWVERRRGEWNEQVTRMDADILVGLEEFFAFVFKLLFFLGFKIFFILLFTLVNNIKY